MPQAGVSAGRRRLLAEESWAEAPERRVEARETSAGAMPRAGMPRAGMPRAAMPSVPDQPERRTVRITGRGAERYVPVPNTRRRPTRPRHERPGFRPDRAAL